MTVVWNEAVVPSARPAGIAHKLLRDPAARVGLALVTVFVVMAVFGPSLAPHDPLEVTVDRLQPPSIHHPRGTDGLGRDLL
ncbi:MAG: hypothetical protein Q8K72_02320, partial [Acidimicrobiales bacterium]|nr:hypothetical protein [Acidimicrobiales bacterium]